MDDELSVVGVPDLKISFSSPMDIVTTLISSAASVHNVSNITRTKYAEIQAALKACNAVLRTREREFADTMLRQKESLDRLYNLLEMSFDGAKSGSGENAMYCRDIAMGLMALIGQVNESGASIIDVSWNL